MKAEDKKTRLWAVSAMLLLMAAFVLVQCTEARAKGPQAVAGKYHTVGLKSDATVVAVGENSYGQTDISSWTGLTITAVAAGGGHTVGLKSDRRVVAVGVNANGQTEVSSWMDIVAVSAGDYHTVGLKSDGTVVGAGVSGFFDGITDWTGITAVAAGYRHTVGLKSGGGTVVAVGENSCGQTDVTGTNWTNVVAVAAGYGHTVGLKSDGTVVAVGCNNDGQTDVTGTNWTNVVAVAAGYGHTVGLKSDGTVVAVGYNNEGQTDVSSWTDIVAVAAGCGHTVGLKSDGTVVAVGLNTDGQTDISSWQLQIPDKDIKGSRGTQVTLKGSGFGSKKGTVSVGPAGAKVIAWYNTRIIFEMATSLTPAEYPIYVTPKGGSTITYGKPFIIKATELQFVQANEGYAEDVVILTGKHFGSKKGKISLGTNSCVVSYWHMNPETGESMAAFKVPKKMAAGHYTVTLTNEAGSATFAVSAFTVKSGKSTHAESSPDQED